MQIRVMRRLAATVTIISTGRKGAVRHGMTATAVTSLSMDPPSLLVCVNRNRLLHSLLTENDGFCVNLLQSEQAAISDVFAGELPPEERFLHGEWGEGIDGMPYLVDAQSSIFCHRREVIDYGSHSIFIGEVRDVRLAADVRPLIYSNGTYSRCTPLAITF
jgi:flavin reductase (DIM6/NTAB) family NADH-FMN oxidoreductase RutF